MLRLLLSVLVVTTLVSLLCVQLLTRSLRRAADERDLVVREWLQQEQQQLYDFDQLYGELRQSDSYYDASRSALTFSVLAHTRQSLQRFVDQHAGNKAMSLPLAEAHFRLGHVCRDLRQLGQADRAFREARELLQASLSPAELSVSLLYGTNSSRLACLLAMMERWAEADAMGQEAVEVLAQLARQNEPQLSTQVELAVACRNLGLIRAAAGRDGKPDLRASIEVSQTLQASAAQRAAVHDMVTGVDLLVDSYQILAALLWQSQEFDAAEALLTQSMEALQTLIQEVRSRPEQRLALPTRRFRKALTLAERNLLELRTQRSRMEAGNQRPPVGELPDRWQWDALYWQPGEVVEHASLTRVRLRGEFEKHDALLLAWRDEDWCQEAILRIARAVSQNIELVVLVGDTKMEARAREAFREAGVPDQAVRLAQVPTDSFWARDYGPLIVETSDGNSRCVDAYYGYGRFLDDAVPSAIAKLFEIPLLRVPIDIEGGAFVSNGAGLCLVSADVLRTNAERGLAEPHLTKLLRRMTGAEQVIYLEPLRGDPTGHLDMFVTFTSANTVVLGDFGDRDPENAGLLNEYADRLAGLETNSQPLQVVRTPMPPRSVNSTGGSYTNVVFANGVLLVPTSREAPPEIEAEALGTFQRLLPDWKVVGIDSQFLWSVMGGPHCATMNLSHLDWPLDAT